MKRVSATTVRTLARRLLLAGLGAVVLAGSNGCKLFEKSADGGTGNSRGSDVASRDPLFGGRLIPKQDIPIPGKSDLAESKDPLLRAGSASNDRREPFRLGPENTSAALAGKPRDDVPAIDDRPSSNNAGRGPVPFTKRNDGPVTASIPNVDNQLDELRRMGAKFASPAKDANGDYTFSAEVTRTSDGPTRRYEGAGSSAAAAVQQVADQIKSDRK